MSEVLGQIVVAQGGFGVPLRQHLETDGQDLSEQRLGLLDVTIERNAYGRQIDSSVRQGDCPELSNRPIEMVFIRAPIIRRVGDDVRVLGHSDGLPVLVEQRNLLAATFHPELTEDETVHRYFLKKLQ